MNSTAKQNLEENVRIFNPQKYSMKQHCMGIYFNHFHNIVCLCYESDECPYWKKKLLTTHRNVNTI